MQGLVTVFGGTGFVGTQVVRALAKRGWRIRVAVRRPGRAYRMRMLGDVGQIQVVQANIRNEASIARALDGAEACINLVGILFESGKQTFDESHVAGPRRVAAACRQAGIQRLIQMSALGADPNSPSLYARTKAAGEAVVREILPSAILIRPSIVFGPEDDFFNRFGSMAARLPVLPLVGGGETRFQPVHVGDVAQAIAAALESPDTPGKTFELAGPAVYSFRELMEVVRRETYRRPVLVPVPWPIANAIGFAGDIQAWAKGGLGLIPAPVLTRDQVALLRADNLPSGQAPGLADLGVQATALEGVVPSYLVRYRRGGEFAERPA